MPVISGTCSGVHACILTLPRNQYCTLASRMLVGEPLLVPLTDDVGTVGRGAEGTGEAWPFEGTQVGSRYRNTLLRSEI